MIDTSIYTVASGTLGGALAGGAITWRHRRPVPSGTHVVHEIAHSDPEEDQRINDAADNWAEAHGRLEAAPLIANKLRLASRLVDQRSRRRSR